MLLTELETPSLVVDGDRLRRNAARMSERIAGLGSLLRPHMKTAKSAAVARIAMSGAAAGITVATLKEAEYFADHGILDQLYAVCISPDKMGRVAALMRKGVDLKIIVDEPRVAEIVAECASQLGIVARTLVEIDCGEHRTGVDAADPRLMAIARILADSKSSELLGVLTHAGHAYECRDRSSLREVAAQERSAALVAASRLREAGFPCPIVSIGSTPTALFADNLQGVSEVRAGVYLFFDLFQSGLGCCTISDIALSVLATVIAHRPSQNRLVVDAGGLALSKDTSRANGGEDLGYGLVTDVGGRAYAQELWIANVHQEHGEIASHQPIDFDQFPIGTRVRILPNHACMTAAQHDRYHVVSGVDPEVLEIWQRTNGWRNDFPVSDVDAPKEG